MNRHGEEMWQSPKILVVEDNPDSLLSLIDLLEKKGCRLRIVTSGRQALKAVIADSPDLVLLDVNLGDMDGYEVCRRMKADESGRDLPVIFISALDESTDRIRGFEAGGIDYISKPFQTTEVLARIKTQLDLRSVQRRSRRSREMMEEMVRRRTAELAMACEALRESESKYKTIFEKMQSGYIRADMEGTILLVNPVALQILGYENGAELIGKNVARDVYVFPEDRERLKALLSDRHQVEGFEVFFKRKNGEPICVSCNNHAVVDAKGRMVALEGLFRDITEEKRAVEELRKSQRLLASVYDAIPGLVNVLDENLNIVYSNWHDHDYVPEEVRQSNPKCYQVFLHKEQPCPDCHALEIFKTGVPCTAEVYNRVDGGYKEVRTFPVLDDRGKVRLVVEHATDITTRKQAEAVLRAEKEKLETVTGNIGTGLVIVSKDFRIKWANRVCKEMFGDVDGMVCHNILNKNEDVCQDCGVVEVFRTGKGPVIHEKLTESADGTPLWLDLITTPIKDEHGNVTAALEVMVPISERKRLEEERKKVNAQLQQAQKMEAMGTLAGGIAHDFNNILSAILGYAEIGMGEVEKGTKAWKCQEGIIHAGNRAKELVKQILTFCRQAEHDFIPVKMQVIVKEALKLLRSTIPSTIEIHQDIDEHCPPVFADPTKIHQVLMNLCTNAYHAMRQKGGVLTVSLHETETAPEMDHDFPGVEGGRYVNLSVSDTGIGILPEHLDKIFEPYFTSKSMDEGTGLGLSVVHGIVKAHKGRISVESEPGRGSVFQVAFPCAQTFDEARALQELEQAVPGGTEHILLVDDEEVIVLVVRSVLESLGYRVTAMLSSMEALHLFKRNPRDFDMLVTDMTMPEMTGADLARAILEIRPDLPIFLCTGYSAQINEEKAKSLGISAFAYKPVTKIHLAQTIRRALDRRSIRHEGL